MAGSAPPGGVRLIHVFMAAFALMTLGCDGDECESGQVRCRDNVAEFCSEAYSDGSAPLVWVSEDCGEGVCKAGLDATPFCALADSPDPRCGEDSDSAVCDQELQVRCRHGYAIAITDCATEAGHCVQPEEGAICATEPEPNELCPAEAFATSCDESTLLDCVSGYVVAREDCSATGQACIVTPGYAACNESGELDPLCPDTPAIADRCDGNVVVECAYGYRVFEDPCEPGLACEVSGNEAFCL
ncbi:MAG TPA: hypothetical protein VM686_06365 [Polyangiaceae bacterium]|nr:hypothetical protein [Polyangiaceae bacterium]